MRLAKHLALSGVASRRRAEEYIRQGRVRVNGLVAREPWVQVGDADTVTVDGRTAGSIEEKEYYLLNKPAGYISTVSDPHGRFTVTELVRTSSARLYPVGRLDADTEGALLLTNDGELAYRLTHPRYGVEKVYRAWVSGFPETSALGRLSGGLVVEGKKTAPARVSLLRSDRSKGQTLLEIVLAEGRKRQVKKMCAAAGHPVTKLKRVSFAGLNLKGLETGACRRLTEREVAELYRMAGL